MCAIFGLALFEGHPFKKKDTDVLKEGVSRLAAICENSGSAASGISLMREKSVAVLRRPVRGSMLIMRPDYKKLLEDNFILAHDHNRLVSVIGHARFPTKGSPTNNLNNHPIVAKHIIGVHNGSISNDDTLFGSFDGLITRMAEVDTEIIFQLISYFSNRQLSSTIDALKKATRYLEGSYACALQNARHPYNLYLFRKNNPIRTRYWHKAKMLAFATRDNYLDHAFNNLYSDKVDFEDHVEIEILPETAIGFNLHNAQYTKFSIARGRQHAAS